MKGRLAGVGHQTWKGVHALFPSQLNSMVLPSRFAEALLPMPGNCQQLPSSFTAAKPQQPLGWRDFRTSLFNWRTIALSLRPGP
jgi:hypothetical protein